MYTKFLRTSKLKLLLWGFGTLVVAVHNTNAYNFPAVPSSIRDCDGYWLRCQEICKSDLTIHYKTAQEQASPEGKRWLHDCNYQAQIQYHQCTTKNTRR